MAAKDHEPLNGADRASRIKDTAASLGFHSCGITDLSPPPHDTALTTWLTSGMAGTMTYMNRQAARRKEPARILEGATRAIVVTRNYNNPDPPDNDGCGKIAKYARGNDYHDTLQDPLETLKNFVLSLGSDTTIARAFVDAGPVPERELGQRAGLGWIGKNTMLIDPTLGSFFFVAEILTNLDVLIDQPFDADRCGTCRKCLDACPTNAFPRERVLDSRLCISYLTIEFKNEFEDQTPSLNGWLFGCDVCQTVCPWNEKFAREVNDSQLGFDPSLGQLQLDEVESLTETEFDDRFGKTPLSRTGRNGLRRNAMQIGHEGQTKS